ncbi:MAG: hypothetical protein ACO3VS_04905 [Limisphaerales bacterium]|jgi:hypothetical protein
MSPDVSSRSLSMPMELGLWGLGVLLLCLIFLWLLKIEPYVRRRNRTSTFFLYPWAPWKDCRDAFKVASRHRRGTPSFLYWFVWLSLTEALGGLVWAAIWLLGLD